MLAADACTGYEPCGGWQVQGLCWSTGTASGQKHMVGEEVRCQGAVPMLGHNKHIMREPAQFRLQPNSKLHIKPGDSRAACDCRRVTSVKTR
jgi:hypothetical protein